MVNIYREVLKLDGVSVSSEWTTGSFMIVVFIVTDNWKLEKEEPSVCVIKIVHTLEICELSFFCENGKFIHTTQCRLYLVYVRLGFEKARYTVMTKSGGTTLPRQSEQSVSRES